MFGKIKAFNNRNKKFATRVIVVSNNVIDDNSLDPNRGYIEDRIVNNNDTEYAL